MQNLMEIVQIQFFDELVQKWIWTFPYIPVYADIKIGITGTHFRSAGVINVFTSQNCSWNFIFDRFRILELFSPVWPFDLL